MAVTSGASYSQGSNWNSYASQGTTQQAPSQASPASTSTDHYEPFFRYAYYYGEETARAYYGAWSPPVGTPNPYGVNPNLGTAPVAAQAQAQAATAVTQQTVQTYAAQQDLRESGQRNVSNLPAWATGQQGANQQATASQPQSNFDHEVRETGKRQVSNLPAWMQNQ